MSFQFYSAKKLLEIIEANKFTRISDVVIETEKELTGHSSEEIFENMRRRLLIMRESIRAGQKKTLKSKSGMVGGESKLMKNLRGKEIFLSELMRKATEYALSVMEVSACMGKIVAAPTAGSSGILPGCLWALQENLHLAEEEVVRGLLTAAGIGVIIGNISTFSAAEAGCQAEVGASAAMTAAGISEVRGLSAERCINAAALALKNMLGLACDPIAGLVEVPCVKRNAFGVVHAMTASDMSYAGITSIVPFDEVVKAMNNIAKNMNENIRETAKGGLAMSKTGKKISEKVYGKKTT
ncbi:L-serine ammonia-lyase, iron-sulfur-dependent, subunit alpha [Candidatus Peregrinibacteria bacterium]|nr:L-serine ammonia-lyase, iron-sulfur-dependent, subunit alpha [Candidatus Peregrinibacteria bacterium]